MNAETLDMALAAVREFANRRLSPARLLELDREEVFPLDVIREMCGDALGVQLIFIEEEFGGMGGGAWDVYRVCEELARIDIGVATGVLATFLGSDPIKFGGTHEQQARWMSQIAAEGLLMAYAATEPEAGSDLGALRTIARPVVEDGVLKGYRITGNKQWISNGGHADLYTVLAKTPGGPSWFVVDKGTPGLTPGRPEQKHGIRASNTAPIAFEDVFVEPDRLVGGVEGQGLVQAQLVFGFTRLMVAAFGLGGGWAALDRAIPYSVERRQAGGPLSEKQGFTHKLIVPHVVHLEAARAYVEETAERIDAGELKLNTEGAIAKYLATEAGNAAADAAIQALGGYGYTHEYHVEKIRRDVRITTIYEGTSEIMEMTIARDRWTLHLQTSGRYYRDQAREMEALEGRNPGLGAGTAALALHGVAELMERARVARLTRQQHVLMRLGEIVAFAEGAASLSRRAARAARGESPAKAHPRFGAPALAVMARVYARQASRKVADGALCWIVGADGVPDSELAAFEATLGGVAIRRAQAGLLADMDRVADFIYGRA